MFPELVRLAWPICVSMLSFSTMTLVDTAFVGRLGAHALAGVGLGGVSAFTTICFAFGLLRAVKVLTSQAVGAMDRGRLQPVLGAGLWVAVALGAVAIAIGLPIARLLADTTASPEAGRVASTYMAIRILGAPFVLAGHAIREARYGRGDSRSPMYASVVANLAHIPLDYALIFGLDLGVTGAALATVLSQLGEMALLVVVQRNDGFGLRAARLSDALQIWKLGAPLGVELLLEVGAFSALVVLIAGMSDVDLAAHQVALQIVHFAFLPSLAVGEAASVLAGQAVGADEDRLVRRVAGRALRLALGYALLCGAVFIAGGAVLLRAFTPDPEVQRVGVRLLYVAAAFELLDAVKIVTCAVLRGTGDVRVPAAANIASAWTLVPSLTWLLGVRLHLGAVGGWLALCLNLAFSATFVSLRLSRGRWMPAAQRSRERGSPLAAAAHAS